MIYTFQEILDFSTTTWFEAVQQPENPVFAKYVEEMWLEARELVNEKHIKQERFDEILKIEKLKERLLSLREEIVKGAIAREEKKDPDNLKIVLEENMRKMEKEAAERMERRDATKEEAQKILEITETDIKILLQEIHKLGPKIAVITDGPKGAYCYDGSDMLFQRAYPDPKPPLERTGAGDAFSSTFTSALALGKNIREALMWAPINSMSVVQEVGARAGLLTRKKLEEYLALAPEDYKPQKI
jgi:sugar/nucleoside kinase (ribokinase family)